MNNKLTTKTILELKDYKFCIPDYQRGYRWTKKEVEDLLGDIDEFQRHKKEKEKYCLQPIVVAEDKNKKYRIIDGQQRLTTINLILKFLNAKNFEISYENEKINLDDLSDDTIDNHYLNEAESKIKEVFNREKQIKDDNDENQNFIIEDKKKFKKSLLKCSFVIWYDVSEEVKDRKEKEIEIFTRLNSGKIPLTNAELVKALFLQKKNFKDNATASQLQIATEWDRIELALQNDAFWYFIHKKSDDYDTRIDYLLELISGEKANEKDNYATFRYFNENFLTNKNLNAAWQEIKNLFLSLQEWHQNHELHHKIGYLIACGKKLKLIFEKSENSTKTSFKNELDKLIKDTLGSVQLKDIDYGNGKIRRILLLHNIQTLINGSDKRNFFPFDKYYKDNWDIEHIHATATDVKVKTEDRWKWLKSNFISCENKCKELEQEIKKAIDNIQNPNDENFEKYIKYILGETDNGLINLCLLDSSTNRAYKNDSFRFKRSKLIKREKEGQFIPICTKNVFMKHYTKNVESLSLWNDSDREAYLKDIACKLKPYLKPTEDE